MDSEIRVGVNNRGLVALVDGTRYRITNNRIPKDIRGNFFRVAGEPFAVSRVVSARVGADPGTFLIR